MNIRNLKVNGKTCTAVLVAFNLMFSSIGCADNTISIAAAIPASVETTAPTIPSFTYTTLYKGQQPTLEQINKDVKQWGKFIANPMPASLYEKAMNASWTKIMPTGVKKDMPIDLTKMYTYKDLEAFMLNFAEYEGVQVDVIGKSVQGRNLYSVTIDLKSPSIEELTKSGMTLDNALKSSVKRAIIKGTLNSDNVCRKYCVDSIDKLTTAQLTELSKEIQVIEQNDVSRPTIMLTGQVHANEFAGSMFILKQINDLLKDQSNRLLYENVRLVTVPVVNPDGREINLVNGTSNKKSNANGVDINRNFPSVGASQLFNGQSKPSLLTSGPSLAYYPGPTLGSEPETQALMKWFNVNVKKTNNENTYYFDYHQHGRGIFVSKPWDHQNSQKETVALGQSIMGYLNQGISSGGYKRIYNITNKSIDGTGGATIDQVMSDAKGMIFSNYWGVSSFNTGDANDPTNKGIPAVIFNTITKENEQYYKPLNPNFQGGTIEVTINNGNGSPLGYKQTARNLMAQEYDRFHFNGLFKFMSNRLVGPDAVKRIETQQGEISKLNKSYITMRETDIIDKIQADYRAQELRSNPRSNITAEELLKIKESITAYEEDEEEVTAKRI